MKDFQQNLLIVLALALCGLCVVQWRGQTVQRNQIGALTQTVYEKASAIQGYTNSISTMDHQIAELSSRISELQQAAQTNQQLTVLQKREINRLADFSNGLTNQVAEYRKAVDTLEAKLKEAYEGIKKQNESLQELAAQRDEFVKKFNESVKERNDIVAKYNELAARLEKAQTSGGK